MPATGIPDYINLFAGHSNTPDFRRAGSSGGVGTELLKYLLTTNKVDYVIGVGFSQEDKLRPVYRAIESPDEIVQLAGSKYVYMELAPLIALLNEFKSLKVAVVVQPCFAKLIKSKFPQAAYVISFFCGYNIVYDGTTYLLKQTKVAPENIESMNYRGGEYPGGFTIETKDGETVHFGKEYYELVDLVFLKEGCSKCSFFISDCADVVLGDCWIKNVKNETAVLTNTPNGDQVLKELHQEKLVTLFDLDKEDLSKMHNHNLHYKTHGHTPGMKFIVKMFNNKWMARLAPFHFMGFLSKVRRHFKYGIPKELSETNKY